MGDSPGTCPNCGAVLPAGSGHCFGCGTDVDLVLTAGDPPVIVRLYRAQDHRHAVEAYLADLPNLVSAGYFPVGQSYGDDDPEGLLDTMFTGDRSWSRPGTLAVTFRYDPWSVAERRLERDDAARAAPSTMTERDLPLD
jgi:hypothetical protein